MIDALHTSETPGINAFAVFPSAEIPSGDAARPHGSPLWRRALSVRDSSGVSQQNGDAEKMPSSDSLELSPEAKAQLRELKQRDAEVRAHERAHMAAGGQYVKGGPHYTFQQGPDGRQYAIGGHVDIDVSKVPGDPEATRQKAEQVRRAASAPGEPSAQDREVAAEAAALSSKAAREEQEQKRHDAEEDASSPKAGASGSGNGDLLGTPHDGGMARIRTHAVHAYADMGMQGWMATSLSPNSMTAMSITV